MQHSATHACECGMRHFYTLLSSATRPRLFSHCMLGLGSSTRPKYRYQESRTRSLGLASPPHPAVRARNRLLRNGQVSSERRAGALSL